MLRHLLKLIWKRKARNLMLSLEILLAFLLLFVIAAFGVRNWQLYHEPTGFAYRDVWAVTINPGNGQRMPNEAAIYQQFTQALQAVPHVAGVAFSTYAPYSWTTYSSEFKLPDGSNIVQSQMMEVTDAFFAVSGIDAQEGRLFSSQDDGADVRPVVINRQLAQALFPGRAAVGQLFTNHMHDNPNVERFRVIGVVDHYRPRGEFSAPDNFLLTQRGNIGLNIGLNAGLPTILLRMQAGTPRSVEAALQRQLKLVRNDWSYTMTPLADQRASMLKTQLMPLAVLSVVAAFLLAMVAFGLFGVLWQNTTRRIPEIGLRRALGAPAGAICRQIIAEQLLLSSGAMLAGLALLVQLPLTGVLGEQLNWNVFMGALGLSMGLIYLLSLLCSLYPGWHASRMTPTTALRHE
jgi:putative ABC transport system permease protein